MMISPYYKAAWQEYKWVYLAGVIYVALVTAEAIHCDVPFEQFSIVFPAMGLVLVKCIVLLLGMAAYVFVAACRAEKGFGIDRLRKARAHLSKTSSAFLDGEMFAHAVLGVPVLFCISFFFIQKSLIQFVNPYHWDPVLAAWDKALHFGHYPQEFLMATAWQVPQIGFVFDISYYLWFVVLYLGVGYNIFLDTDRHRRLQFCWVFFLSWAVIGTGMATWLSSVGPLFFHHFYPHYADPYVDLVRHFDDFGPKYFRIAHFSRDKLMGWATNGRKVNLNALSAMPSMHVAIAWLMVLYARRISRKWFITAAVFGTIIFVASVYFGFHYAIDGYVAAAVVSLMWWGVGRALAGRYPDAKPLKRL